MVAILAAVAVSASVSFASDAVRVDALLEDLASQTGLELRCDAGVGATPVVAQFHERPLDEVLALLGKVVDAEWDVQGGVRRLSRSGELRLKQEREEAKRMAALVDRQVRQALAEVDALPELDRAEADRIVDRYRLAEMTSAAQQAEFVRMSTTSPVRRAAVRLLAAVDPQKLATMRIGERLVFSDVPHPSQLRLPSTSKQPLKALREECRTLLAARERLGEQLRAKANFGGLPEIGPGTLEACYGKTILACTRTGLGRFRLTLLVTDRNGSGILTGATDMPSRMAALFTPYTQTGKPLEISDTMEKLAFLRRDIGYAAASSGTGVRLPDGSTARRQFAITASESEGLPPDLGLGAIFSDPRRWDPLGYAFGPLLRQVASAQGKPLLATISDEALFALLLAVSFKQIATHDGLEQLLAQTQIEEGARTPYAAVVEQEGWLAYKPWLPVAARKQRIDRTALRELIARIRAEGALLLEDAIAYSAKAPAKPGFTSLDSMILVHAVPEVDRQSIESLIGADALPLLASMTSSQLARAAEGVLVRELGPEQKEWIRRWAFEQYPYNAGLLGTPREGGMRAVDLEPTEIFPNGVPLDSGFLIERTQAPAVLAAAKSGWRFAFDLDGMGYQESLGPRGQLVGVTFDREFTSYRPAVRTRTTVRLRIPGRTEMTSVVSETRPAPGSKHGPRDALPKNLLDRIDLVRKAFGGGAPGAQYADR